MNFRKEMEFLIYAYKRGGYFPQIPWLVNRKGIELSVKESYKK